jgi:hypothetical protein
MEKMYWTQNVLNFSLQFFGNTFLSDKYLIRAGKHVCFHVAIVKDVSILDLFPACNPQRWKCA